MTIFEGMLSDYLGALAHRREALRSKTPLAEADTLRLYEALANNPLSAERLARTTGTDPVAVRQWLGRQVAHSHLQYDAARQQYWMSEQQALAIGREPGLCFVPDAFQIWRRAKPFAR
ncbi:hypothetical protein B0G69_4264 [Paraburkholderia sp. RAU2J]|uniref:hypothetical protein n=1 Tax=Paraburkholderia sp. RAU2J TaxID=1938810 RepID=UPI000EB21D88|nr:hypothetical protein [Paraburkholderia sp. RAU2J]RKT20905.1 hypothetical protein B0G69_4264 [Paraburkholderia sp. RAU2J]